MLSALVMVVMLAGKLGDDAGFRGLRFGPDTVLEAAPLEGCVAGVVGPAGGARWSCPATIGNQAVTVLYMARNGFFTGVIIRGAGLISCDALKATFTAAWGEPSRPTGSSQQFYWNDGGTWALFELERTSATCTLMLSSKPVQEQAEAAAHETVNHGVQDL